MGRSGKALHVDQILWQNIGKNWTGYKLIAAFPVHETAVLLDHCTDCLFRGPDLSDTERKFLEKAIAVVLIRPGDVFYFTGGIPHVTLSVGPEINMCAYESIVTLNKAHVLHFL